MRMDDGRDGAMMRIDLHDADVLKALRAQAARVFLGLPGLSPALPQSGAARFASHEDDIALPSGRPGDGMTGDAIARPATTGERYRQED